jgi:hypothetical protein
MNKPAWDGRDEQTCKCGAPLQLLSTTLIEGTLTWACPGKRWFSWWAHSPRLCTPLEQTLNLLEGWDA